MAKIALPYKWRQKVQQLLDKQAVKLTPQKIYDIKRGKYPDEVLTKKVMEAIKQVSRDHRQTLKRVARLTAKKK